MVDLSLGNGPPKRHANEMLQSLIQFGKWIAILVFGYFAISFFVHSTASAGAGAGTGVFSYWFRASVTVWPKSENDSVGSIHIQGNAVPRFMLWGHTCPTYKKLEIEWQVFNRIETKGRAILDLKEMSIDQDGRFSRLNEGSLSSLLNMPAENPRDAERVARILKFIHSARDGTLPPPQHHGIELPASLSGRMQHFATGTFVPPVQLTWIIVWIAIGFRKLFCSRSYSVLTSNEA